VMFALNKKLVKDIEAYFQPIWDRIAFEILPNAKASIATRCVP
jgi:hypothetical protein